MVSASQRVAERSAAMRDNGAACDAEEMVGREATKAHGIAGVAGGREAAKAHDKVLSWKDAVALLSPDERYGLAFSGGCDSSFLLAAMRRAGLDVKAYMVMTAFQAPFELEDARRVVEETGAGFELIRADILSQADVCANPLDRCYLCKRFIFGKVLAAMERDGRRVLLDGTNATDDPANRPGFRALAELGVRSPLREAGFTKDDVRAASRAMNLSTADKPNFSCFATKVPSGEPLTCESLGQVAHSLGMQLSMYQ